MSNDEWINATEAQAYIGRTDRQLRRYAQQGRVRTRKRGGRVEYARADLDLVRESMPDDPEPRGGQQIVPAGELLGYVRELQEQLQQSAAREGYLRAQLEQRLALTDERALRDELAQERQHRKAIEAEKSAAQAELRRANGGRRNERIFYLVIALVLIAAIAYLLFIR